jgi:hypothetical protein
MRGHIAHLGCGEGVVYTGYTDCPWGTDRSVAREGVGCAHELLHLDYQHSAAGLGPRAGCRTWRASRCSPPPSPGVRWTSPPADRRTAASPAPRSTSPCAVWTASRTATAATPTRLASRWRTRAAATGWTPCAAAASTATPAPRASTATSRVGTPATSRPPIIAVDAGVGMPPPPVSGVCRPIEVPCGWPVRQHLRRRRVLRRGDGHRLRPRPALPGLRRRHGSAHPPRRTTRGVAPPIDPSTGVCRPLPEQFCGGIYGDTCGEGEYCDITVTMDPPQERPVPGVRRWLRAAPRAVRRVPPDRPARLLRPQRRDLPGRLPLREQHHGGPPAARAVGRWRAHPASARRVRARRGARLSERHRAGLRQQRHHLPERLCGRVHGRHGGLARPLPPAPPTAPAAAGWGTPAPTASTATSSRPPTATTPMRRASACRAPRPAPAS